MNPETKATAEQIRVICAKHDIPYRSHRRITTGFSHEVHRLNADLILKLYNSENTKKYEMEAAMLASNLPFRKPELIVQGGPDGLIDRNYIIMTYVAGVSLGGRWHKATDVQREALVREICSSLVIINRIDPVAVGLIAADSWGDIVRQRGEVLTAKLQAKQIISASTARQAIRTFDRYAGVFAGSPLYVVHWDIQFDNFIVNEQFELQALIDLENVELAALDYPLFILRNMTDEPKKFLKEDEEKFADKADYAQLLEWYKKYYPAMFDFEDLQTRVRIYQLLDTLHLLADWSHIPGLHKKLTRLTSPNYTK